MPLSKTEQDELQQTMGTLSDRLVAGAVEKSTLAQKERSQRYWFTHCDLMGIPRVMRTHAEAAHLAEFGGLLGMAWKTSSKTEDRGMAAGTVSGILSGIRSWHSEVHHIDLKAMEYRSNKVCKALKKLAGPQLPLMRLKETCYKHIIKPLRADPLDTRSNAIADAVSWCYEALFRISEIADTISHCKADNTQRYLMHADVHSRCTADGRPRKLDWTLRNTKQKEEVQNRSLWASGTQELEADDVVAATDDFVVRMNNRIAQNETFIATHPHRRDDLPFIHVNGEPVHRKEVEAAIDAGLQSAFAAGLTSDPKNFRVGTHTCRRGGATLYYENGISDKSIMWLGRWASLAWLVYPEVTDKAARSMSGLVHW